MNTRLDNPARDGRLLRVEAPYFVAASLWVRDESGDWRCTLAAPILAWMRDKAPGEVRAQLESKGWRWSWH